MDLHNYYKKKLLLRNVSQKNVNSLKFLETGVIYYSLPKDCSLNSVATCYAILKLIASKSPVILRAKKSSALFKIRKGIPVGAKVNLRKAALNLLYFRLLYQIFPNLTTFKPFDNFSKNQEFILTLKIEDIFLFPELRPFYFYFSKYSNLRISLKFNESIAKLSPKFFFSLCEFPVKN